MHFAPSLALAVLAALAPGTPVRMQLADSEPLNGRLVSSDGAALVVDVGGRGPVRVPRQSIVRLEAVRARRQALKGLLIGAGWFAVLGVGTAHCPPRPELPPCRPLAEIAAIFAGVGAVSGAAVGSLFTTRDWSVLPSQHVHVGVTPVPLGAALTMAVRF